MRATEAAHALRRRLPSDAEARVVDSDELDLAESLPLRMAVDWATEDTGEAAPALSATAAAEYALHASGLRCVPTTAESRAAMVEDGQLPDGLSQMPVDGGTVALRGAGHRPTTIGYSGARRVAKQTNAMPLAGSGRSRSLMYDRWRRGLTAAQPASSGSRLDVAELRKVLMAEEEAAAGDIRDLHEKLAVTACSDRIGALESSRGTSIALAPVSAEQRQWHAAVVEAAAAAQREEDAARAEVQAATMAVEGLEAEHKAGDADRTAGGTESRAPRARRSSLRGGGANSAFAKARQGVRKRGMARHSISRHGEGTASKVSERRASLRTVDTRSPETILNDRQGRSPSQRKRSSVAQEAEAATRLLNGEPTEAGAGGGAAGQQEQKQELEQGEEEEEGLSGPERLAIMSKVCRVSAVIDILKRRRNALEHPEEFEEGQRMQGRHGVARSRGGSMEWGEVSSLGTGDQSPSVQEAGGRMASPQMSGISGPGDWTNRHLRGKKLTMMAAMSAATQAAAIAAGAFGEGGTGGFSLQAIALGGDPQEAASEAAARAADLEDQAGRVDAAMAAIDKELAYWRQERDNMLRVLPAGDRPRALQGVAALRERGAAQWEGIAAADALDALAAARLDSRLATSGRLRRSDRGAIQNRAEATVLSAVCNVAPLSAVSLATSAGSLTLLQAPSSLLHEPAELLGSLIEARDPTSTVLREDAAERRMRQVSSQSVGVSPMRATFLQPGASSPAVQNASIDPPEVPLGRSGLGVVCEAEEEEEEEEEEHEEEEKEAPGSQGHEEPSKARAAGKQRGGPAGAARSGLASASPGCLPAVLDWGTATDDPRMQVSEM